MDNQKLGIFITELRKEKGLTQAQLAAEIERDPTKCCLKVGTWCWLS